MTGAFDLSRISGAIVVVFDPGGRTKVRWLSAAQALTPLLGWAECLCQ
jgi:hypothetical protein